MKWNPSLKNKEIAIECMSHLEVSDRTQSCVTIMFDYIFAKEKKNENSEKVLISKGCKNWK